MRLELRGLQFLEREFPAFRSVPRHEKRLSSRVREQAAPLGIRVRSPDTLDAVTRVIAEFEAFLERIGVELIFVFVHDDLTCPLGFFVSSCLLTVRSERRQEVVVFAYPSGSHKALDIVFFTVLGVDTFDPFVLERFTTLFKKGAFFLGFVVGNQVARVHFLALLDAFQIGVDAINESLDKILAVGALNLKETEETLQANLSGTLASLSAAAPDALGARKLGLVAQALLGGRSARSRRILALAFPFAAAPDALGARKLGLVAQALLGDRSARSGRLLALAFPFAAAPDALGARKLGLVAQALLGDRSARSGRLLALAFPFAAAPDALGAKKLGLVAQTLLGDRSALLSGSASESGIGGGGCHKGRSHECNHGGLHFDFEITRQYQLGFAVDGGRNGHAVIVSASLVSQ